MKTGTTRRAPQHMRALEQANRVRLARAELKRQVGEGETTVAEVIAALPREVESMTIAELLMSQHRWGRQRCRRLLAAIPMSETKAIGSMTDRQREALTRQLGERPEECDGPFGLGYANPPERVAISTM